jgi:hypothetical protein
MSKSFDELLKVLETKGEIPTTEAEKIIKEHGALSDEEKKQVAAAIKMKKALTKSDDKDKKDDNDKGKSDEVTFDDYMQALSTLDADGASKEDKDKAQKIKDKFESQ